MPPEPTHRPASVPADAVWDDDGWERGEKDAEGRKIGSWPFWREDGSVAGVTEWGDGVTRMTYQRVHPDGALAQSGEKDLVTDRWVGVMRWTRQAAPSPEDRFFPSTLGADVRVFEVDLVDSYVITERYFDASGARVTNYGDPLPERPASVPETALFLDAENIWLSQQKLLGHDLLRGAREAWDRNGTLQFRTLYRDDGTLEGTDTFRDGVLWSLKRHAPNGDLTQSFFHYGSDPRVLSQTTLYRNNQKDRETTYFDKAGQRAFSVRMEQVTDHHLRRYDDGHLVLEAIWSDDPTQPPQKVEYYDLVGNIIVRYTPTTKGTGVWTLHASDGSVELELPETDEHDLNKYGNWSRFLPGFARYELSRTTTDPDVIRDNFREAYGEEVAAATLAKLKPSKELVAALGSAPWTKVDCAMGGAKQLPALVKGVLADDDTVASYALDRIWIEIEHQGSVYEATYRIATALATMFPLLADRPAVQHRVFRFLRDVLDLPAINDDTKAFATLAKTLHKSSALLESWATSADPTLAAEALRVAGRIGAGLDIAARLVTSGDTAAARAYATCVYALGGAKSKALLARAFAAEADPFVQFIQALFLVRDHGATSPAYLAAIEPHLLDASPITAAFAPLAPFLGTNVTEAILAALPAKVLAKHVDKLVADLPQRGSLVQVSYLHVILGLLFPHGLPPAPTLSQQTALRTLADVIDARGNFVNHKEVYRAYDLPYDSFALREAAAAAAKKPAAKAKKKPAAKKPAAKKPAAKKPAAKKPAAKKPATSKTKPKSRRT